MKTKNLKSSNNYRHELTELSDLEYRLERERYDTFIEQDLTLGMFIPCDLEGNVLEKPKAYRNYLSYNNGVLKENHPEAYKLCKQYQQALDRVVFVGNWKHDRDDRYTYMNWMVDLDSPKNNLHQYKRTIQMHNFETIEDLTHLNLEYNETP